MFRRIYWVVENGSSAESRTVKGVYTSIPDLLSKGMHHERSGTRLTLVKLDAEEAVLGTWDGPTFSGVVAGIEPFVSSGEIPRDHLDQLTHALGL
ncbi:MAG: hypothetical protein JST35_11520 [Armatimonadetes bacterium]|nr:hypothetical protein [Armatimonadota bacterium]